MTETHTPLPCPFCGHQRKYNYADAPCGDRRYWTVICEGCEAHGPPFSECSGGEAEALTAWNTRADSHHRLVEALGRMIEIAHAYGEYISQVPSAELERHPYLPGLEDEINDARAALKEAGRG